MEAPALEPAVDFVICWKVPDAAETIRSRSCHSEVTAHPGVSDGLPGAPQGWKRPAGRPGRFSHLLVRNRKAQWGRRPSFGAARYRGLGSAFAFAEIIFLFHEVSKYCLRSFGVAGRAEMTRRVHASEYLLQPSRGSHSKRDHCVRLYTGTHTIDSRLRLGHRRHKWRIS